MRMLKMQNRLFSHLFALVAALGPSLQSCQTPQGPAAAAAAAAGGTLRQPVLDPRHARLFLTQSSRDDNIEHEVVVWGKRHTAEHSLKHKRPTAWQKT
jgi:hypothetical protein